MNLTTSITPAARRIARKVNDTPASQAVEFDIDGNVVDVHPRDMWYTPGSHPEGIALTIPGAGKGGHVTYRSAQDSLDAIAAYPADPDMRGFYLQELATEREAAR